MAKFFAFFVSLACSVAAADEPAHRIIHILDWHYVDRDKFAAALNSQGEISDADIDRQFAKLIQEVEKIQAGQTMILRKLVKEQGLKTVRIEGMTERDIDVIKSRVNAIRRMAAEIRRFEQLAADSAKDGVDTTEFDAALTKLKDKHRHDLLRLGAAGRLVVAGELDAIHPLEDFAAYRGSRSDSGRWYGRVR